MFKNKKKLSIVLVTSLVAMLALGLMAFASIGTVSAASPEGNGSGQRGPGGDKRGGGGPGGDSAYLADALGITEDELKTAMEEVRSNVDGAGSREDFNALLADALGITVDELDAAREAAKDAAIAQAIADGDLTEEQVALMEAREALRNYMEKDEMLAKALGITIDELETAQTDGKRIPDLLEELGLDEETFKANMEAAREDALNQAVADGVITQEQADQLQEDGLGGPGGHGKPGRGGRQSGDEKPDGEGSGRPGRPGGQPPTDNGNNG